MALLLTLAVVAGCGGAPEPPPSEPDVFLILLDSLRADTQGARRDGRAVMPNLDAWSTRHVRFTEAQAPSPSTPTSVSAMLTSLPVPAINGSFYEKLPAEAEVLAERLTEAGYRTFAYSANPNFAVRFGHDRGFDVFVEAFDDPSLATGAPLRKDTEERIAPAEALFSRALEDLADVPRGEPVFVYLHVFQPHAPYVAPAAHRLFADPDVEVPLEVSELVKLDKQNRFRRKWLAPLHARYDELAHYVDEELGRFLSMLESHERFRTAAVAVVSDHGEAFGEHGKILHNTTVYEEMIRIPISIRPPGQPQPARVIDTPVDLIDLAPTILALAGLDAPESFGGVDLLAPADAGGPSADRLLISASVVGGTQLSARVGSYKLIREPGETAPRDRLFQLALDPGEQRDVTRAAPDKARELGERLTAELERLESLGLRGERTLKPNERVLEMLRSLGYVVEGS